MDVSIRHKSAIGLVYIENDLVAEFKCGLNAESYILRELAEEVKSYYFGQRKISFIYSEKIVQERPDLMVAVYRGIVSNGWLVVPILFMGSDEENSVHWQKQNLRSLSRACSLMVGKEVCPICKAAPGQFHDVCPEEICPRCNGKLLKCGCTRRRKNRPPGPNWTWMKDGWWPDNSIRIAFKKQD